MLYVSLGGRAIVLALFTLTTHHKALAAVTIVLIGALGFAAVPPLQKRVLDHASGAPTPASAVNIGAFNPGNALSAWLGGLVIAAGLGYTAPNWVGALMALATLLLALVSADRAAGRCPSLTTQDAEGGRYRPRRHCSARRRRPFSSWASARCFLSPAGNPDA
jgi:DHA1 family inner membrane transport protein